MIDTTRQFLAQFFGFGGDAGRVVFTQNATDSLNMVMGGLMGPGDHLVISRIEHNSVLRPANHLERDLGIDVTRVGRDGSGYLDPDDIRRAITPKRNSLV